MHRKKKFISLTSVFQFFLFTLGFFSFFSKTLAYALETSKEKKVHESSPFFVVEDSHHGPGSKHPHQSKKFQLTQKKSSENQKSPHLCKNKGSSCKANCKCRSFCHCHSKKKKAVFGHLMLISQTDFKGVQKNQDTGDYKVVNNQLKDELRYMLKVGTQYKLNPHLEFLFRLRSNSKSYHHPAHHFGILDVGHNHILGVDQVYGKYTLLTEEESKDSPFNVHFKFGKFAPPWWNQSNVYLNRNIQFDGMALEFSAFDYFKYSLAYSVVRAEEKNNGFTSNPLRAMGDFFLMNHLKTHFSYDRFYFDLGLTLSHMNDGRKSKGEVQPITVYNDEDEVENKYFASEYFYIFSARLKNTSFPIHFSLGGDYLWSSVDNGDKKNSSGHVLLFKASYKKFKLAFHYYNVGDAAIPLIGGSKKMMSGGHTGHGTGDSMHSVNEKMHSNGKTEEKYLGEFFSTDHFYSLNGHINGYMMRGLAGFTGFFCQFKWHISNALHLGFRLYQLELKASNRFLAHKMHKSDASWRTRTYLGLKF